MVARSHHRGHPMYFADKWRYSDDNSLVEDGHQDRPCNHCGELYTLEGHDACIPNLPGVRNACCGHGDQSSAYIQFDDGSHIQGINAIKWMDSNRTLLREQKL